MPVQADSEKNPPSVSAVFAAVVLEYRAALFLGVERLLQTTMLVCAQAVHLSVRPKKHSNLDTWVNRFILSFKIKAPCSVQLH